MLKLWLTARSIVKVAKVNFFGNLARTYLYVFMGPNSGIRTGTLAPGRTFVRVVTAQSNFRFRVNLCYIPQNIRANGKFVYIVVSTAFSASGIFHIEHFTGINIFSINRT